MSTLMRGRRVSAARRSSRVRGEPQVRRAVAPWSLHHRANGPQRETLLGDGRSQKIATQLFEPTPILARHRDARVQIEAIASRLQRV
jgi:hypothetical protein